MEAPSLRGYLAKHNDVEADAVGLDERAALAAAVAVVLGEPEGEQAGSRERARSRAGAG